MEASPFGTISTKTVGLTVAMVFIKHCNPVPRDTKFIVNCKFQKML